MSDMLANLLNFPHLHMLINHFPTVGTVLGIGLMAMGYVRRNDHIKKVSLEVIFLIAVITLPVYLTGVAAEENIEQMTGVSVPAMNAHQDAAISAFTVMMLAGLAAWLALWQYRRRPALPNGTVAATFLLALLSLALMGRAASIGGEIRHPEIITVEGTGVPENFERGLISAATIQSAITDYPWLWPAAESIHFLGLCLAFGVLIAINLRLLGFMKGYSFAALHRLLPWGLLAFGINLVTGMLFFISAAEQYTQNPIFYWKVIFMAIAGAQFLYLTVFNGIWSIEAGQEARSLDKVIAATSIGLWVGVMYWGRMLPFLGNAF